MPKTLQKGKNNPSEPSSNLGTKNIVTPRIIFQDDLLLVLDKPAGWIVNEAQTTKNQPVVQTWLSSNFDYAIAKDKTLRSGIVHRLDKETSGVLIVAKEKEAQDILQRQFKLRLTKKEYIALAHGKIEPKKGTVEVPVGRLPWSRRKFGVMPKGRASKTTYEVSKYYAKEGETFSLLFARPTTGRTHQIRIHLKYLGHPIVSDNLYAGRKTSRRDRIWCPRLFLHAAKLSLAHPKTKRTITFESPLPRDLKLSLGILAKPSQKT